MNAWIAGTDSRTMALFSGSFELSRCRNQRNQTEKIIDRASWPVRSRRTEMYWIKQCTKCGGDLASNSDQYGPYVSCMQCG